MSHCGTANANAGSPRRSGRSAASVAGIALVIGAVLVGLVFFLPVIRPIIDTEADPPGISILPPFRQEPKVIPQEELVEYMLQLINKDRASFGLEPVKLGSNAAAQIHAEDVYRNKQISHWMSNGEKPYITYSKYGGVGSVGQNVAIAGFSREQYELCMKSTRYNCEVIDPLVTLKELQYEMMYNDTECCDDGHRNNILNKFRTDVSIGIVYDNTISRWCRILRTIMASTLAYQWREQKSRALDSRALLTR